MPKGSEDYWMTKSRFTANILDALLTSLSSGGAITLALDAIDGKFDGSINLSALDDESIGVLARLAGIDTNLLSGSNLVDALDLLDTTMDGKLDLSELNGSLIKTNLDTTNAKLQTSIDRLDTTIVRLSSLLVIGYMNITTACKEIAGIGSGICTMMAHPDNSAQIRGYDAFNCGGTIWFTLNPGDTFIGESSGAPITVKSVSGTQKLSISS